MPTRQGLESKDPAVHARAVQKIESTPSRRAIRLRDGIRIYPRYIRPGQTVVIVLSENPKQPTVKHPGVAWEFSGDLAVGPVKPCTPVDVPGAFDIGDGTPPPGS
jgi:hypothetical protein